MSHACLSHFLLCAFFAMANIGHVGAAIYYVDSTGGNDSWNGQYPSYQGGSSGPWNSIEKVNSYAGNPGFSDGDVVRFKRGEVFDDRTLGYANKWGTELVVFNVNSITFEDYGTGNKPLFDGDKIRPIYIDDDTLKSLTIRNIDISGQDWLLTKASMVKILWVDNVTIDGVVGDGHAGSNGTNSSVGHCVVFIGYGDGVIEVKNCNFYNWGPSIIPTDNMSDTYAFTIDKRHSGSISVHDNIVHDINADGIQVRASTAPGEIYNNIWYNCGENAVDIKQSHNIDVHHNDFYREPGFNGKGGVGGSEWPLINIISNIETSGPYTSDDNIIRDNYMHNNNGESAVNIGWAVAGHLCCRNSIYRNRIENCGDYGIKFQLSATDTLIYNNIIIDDTYGGIYANQPNSGNKVYNNSIYSHDSSVPRYGVYIRGAANVVDVKNNIIYLNNNSTSAYSLYVIGGSAYPAVAYNNWYNNNSANRVYWKGTVFTSTQQSNWRNAGHPGELFADPQFVNPTAGDFYLQFSSPAIDAGIDVGLTQDFYGRPVPQGSVPDIGAYEYYSPGELADLNDNGEVNLEDFAVLASYWMNDNICSEHDWCQGSDFDRSGTIDLLDLATFIESWLWQTN